MNPLDAADAFMLVANRAQMAGLDAAGETLKKMIRQRLMDYREDSKLIASVDYKIKGPTQGTFMQKMSVDIGDSNYQIPDPEKELSMTVGAGAPYALVIAKGAHPHSEHGDGNLTPEDGTFMEKMEKWAARYGVPHDEMMSIADYISKNGTQPHPFMPSEQEIEEIVGTAVQRATALIWSRTRLPDVVYKVGSK